MTENSTPNKAELLTRIEAGWNELNARIQALTEAQLTGPTDAAGWTGKDHLMHLAVWEGGIVALLNGQSRREAMGVDEAAWESKEYDRINAIIQQRHKDLPLAEVLKTFRQVHQRMIDTLENLTEEDLQRPYSSFQPIFNGDGPIINRIIGNTFHHYAEHLPYIDAIVKS